MKKNKNGYSRSQSTSSAVFFNQAAEKVNELNKQIKHLESLIENCKNEIQEMEKEALEERKSKAINLLQDLPNETLCEIVNHFEERLKTVGSENEEQ